MEGNFAHNIKYFAICCVYYPPRATYHNELMDHLINSVDHLRVTYDDLRVLIIGDLNQFDKEELMTELTLQCIVTEPTHRNSILDVILTDSECHTTTTVHAPIGLSEHKCVLCQPARPPPPTYTTKIVRPWRDSNVREFGQWVTAEEFHNILQCEDPNEAAESLETLLRTQYERCFPLKRVRMRSDSKPWITAHILGLIRRRRKEWDRGRMDRWRELYHTIRQQIRQAKRDTAVNIEEHPPNSIKFAKGLKNVLGVTKKRS